MLYSVWILGLLAALLYLLKKAKGCLLKSMQSLNRHCQRQFRASTHLKIVDLCEASLVGEANKCLIISGVARNGKIIAFFMPYSTTNA